MQKENKFFFIDETAIRRKYSSIANFRKEEGISVGVYDGLNKKTTDIFKHGSKSWKAYNKLLDMGYIKFNDNHGEVA